MALDARNLEVESERTYVVYDSRTGEIVHIHRVVTHRGATPVSDEQSHTGALEMAVRFGAKYEKLRVLATDKFDATVPQRVNTKTLTLVSTKPTGPREAAKHVAKKPANAVKGVSRRRKG